MHGPDGGGDRGEPGGQLPAGTVARADDRGSGDRQCHQRDGGPVSWLGVDVDCEVAPLVLRLGDGEDEPRHRGQAGQTEHVPIVGGEAVQVARPWVKYGQHDDRQQERARLKQPLPGGDAEPEHDGAADDDHDGPGHLGFAAVRSADLGDHGRHQRP